MKRHRIYSLQDVQNHLLRVHGLPVDDAHRQNLLISLPPYPKWKLRWIPIRQFCFQHVNWNMVVAYTHLKTEAPTIVAVPFGAGRFETIDGEHRLHAARENGMDRILAFTPITR